MGIGPVPDTARVTLLLVLLGTINAASVASTKIDSLPIATRTALAEAQARWNASSPDNYEFEGHCGGWVVLERRPSQWRVQVRNDRVTRADRYDGFLDLEKPPTMAQIFEEIDRKLLSKKSADGNLLVKAEFDPVLGYPKAVYVEDTDMSDSWVYCTIAKVKIHKSKAPDSNG